MAKRGRRSAADLSIIPPVSGKPDRLRPRDDAPEGVRKIWRELVAKVPPEHFRPSDADLVEQYAQAIALARLAYSKLAAEGPVIDNRPSAWLIVLEKAHKSAVSLSARLRLSPQHRLDPRTVHRHEPTFRRPWEDEPEAWEITGVKAGE
jgi:phage terminase small subunit